ncbi:MAG: protein TolQ [Gammaproteobacteria bacterium]|nr:protein TolQ [Gammaproteobacteria bacterium]NNC97166.1 protein TolQ [Gammaproteobacteria bacterium]NNM13641.1 protein TolQ [Gammaproteobacteria bacterium]
MHTELSPISLFFEASTTVQLVMIVLFLASLLSLGIIWKKHRIISKAVSRADKFEKMFWAGGDLSNIFQTTQNDPKVGMVGLFHAGFSEFSKLSKQNVSSEQLIDATRRSMQVERLREVDRLESNLATLATIGSTSPYVGLFGTVWGIMGAFIALGAVKYPTLADVAPSIAEALIATAMGLVAAIPAVIAYNRFADKVDRLETRYQAFMEEFAAILQRHATKRGS